MSAVFALATTSPHPLSDGVKIKFIFIQDMLRWFTNSEDDIVITIEDGGGDNNYNPALFGHDVAKTVYNQEEVEQFTTINQLSKLKLQVSQPHCTVCLEAFGPKTRVRKLHCGHVFHTLCADAWLKTSKTCPLCVADIQPPQIIVEKKVDNATSKKRNRRSTPSSSALGHEQQMPRRRSKRLCGLDP